MSIDTDLEFKANHWEREAKRLIAENSSLKNELLLAESAKREHKGDSSFVPVQTSGTVVPTDAVDFTDIIAALEEAHGFAAISPAGRDNIEFAIDKLAALSTPATEAVECLRYRPNEFDDWGMIRKDGGEMFATVSRPLSKEEADRHRRNGTDPFEWLALALIAALRAPDTAARMEAEREGQQ